MARNIRIGDYLVDQGKITQEQLDHILAVQKESGGSKRFGECVVECGYLSEIVFAQLLAAKFRIPFVDLAHLDLDSTVVQKIPENLAKKYNVIAINIQGKRLTVATDDPYNLNILEELKGVTGMDTNPVFAARSAITRMIGKHYGMQNIDTAMSNLTSIEGLDDVEDADSRDRVNDAPIVKLTTTIVENSFRNDATDIHIEPFKTHTRIRIRVNGDLIELMNISSQIHNALTTRIKLISGMNIAEKRIPQDGRFTQIVDNVTLDVRVSALPTVHGEKIVIRILSTGNIALRTLEALGMTPYNLDLFKSMLKCPHGVVLVTGPTGSGKTTTLYAALGAIAKPSVNVITVEDPVEKQIEGINQVQVNEKAGMTFPAALRSILRQDPDIVMIGEMRDSETAEIGIRASITGHLVLSTLHTNDAASTITRLIDMDIPPYMVATSLIGVVAQRLVKVLCPNCKRQVWSTQEDNKLMRLDNIEEAQAIYEAVGCDDCNQTGYRGRTAIHEIIHCTGKVSEMIAANSSREKIEETARENGTLLLRDNVSQLVLDGVTTIDELIHVTYSV